MSFRKKVRRGMWIALVSLLMVSSATIYVYARKEKEYERGSWSEERWTQRHGGPVLQSTLALMGSEVRSIHPEGTREEEKTWSEKVRDWHEGKKLGKAKEIMFDKDNDVVHCVIVSAHGKYYPVPWQAFNMKCLKAGSLKSKTGGEQEYGAAETEKEKRHWEWHKGEKERLCLDISKEQFKNAPSIDSVTMKNLSDPLLKQEVCDFYSQHGMLRGTRGKWAMGGKIMRPGGQKYREWAMANLVKCSDVIDMHVEDYAGGDIAEIEDVIIGTHHGTLAYALVDFGGYWGIAEDKAAVPWSALTIEPDKDIALLDATQETMTAAVIEKDNWERLSEREFARKIHRNFEAEPYWEVFAFVPAVITTESLSAWQPGSSYNQRFNQVTMRTIRGKLRNVGAFRPEEGAARGLRLRVKPEEGKTVIMASEITVGGRTLQLRDSGGRPRWELESMER